ncbi:MAG: 6,7-dimethyl-8-ribityllumazine synthase [Legionellaceae bacterium]|nr:6,7-dimethyl-8-ribityllumazine synthase [Legionellaceae bacterium]
MKHIKSCSELKDGSFAVAIIVSLFNQEVTSELLKGAVSRLIELGVSEDDITIVEVPGAAEIPFVAARLMDTDKYEVVIALGAVIRGETTHYDYVCQQVSDGCQNVSLTFDIPIIFGILTTENEAQAWDRLGGKHGHKGKDCADSAIAMLNVLKLL